MPQVLELKEVYKSFAGVHALSGVSFELEAGEIHALMGENGAGKSTLVKIMTGVHQPDAGAIVFDGQPVRFTTPLVAQELGIAAIYQDPTLFPDLDVAENIFLLRQPVNPVSRSIAWQPLYERTRQLLHTLGAGFDPRARVSELSFANRQIVEIAKALSINARVLIMDEPTSALTPREVDDLFTIARRLRAAGTAIVFISHRLEECFDLADRVTVMRDGQYIGTRRIAEVTPGEVIRMMVGRTLDTLYPKEPVEAGETLLRVEGLAEPGAFAGISFELRRGEILALAGLVGAGRTEVARAIFGITPAAQGTIWVEGKRVRIRSPEDALALGIAYVPEDRQQQGLVLPMPVVHNVTLPLLSTFARLGWIDRQAEASAGQDAVARLEVKSAGIWQRVRELSGGNQQKVVLAKWLAVKPRILILDEPTRGIDVGTKAEVHRLMSRLAGQGVAILMISSELPEVLGMSDRILVMHEGRLAGTFARAEATQELIMAAATGAAPPTT